MSTGESQFKGLPLRADIATMMVKEGLSFLRYGGTMVNAPAYRWKNMTGSRDTRPPYKGHWYPYSSNGFGIEEFVRFCEAASFEPAFAINVEETPEDVADMVEYLTGDASSAGGRRRAAAGHPAPYRLHYIEIGNEEVIGGDKLEDYEHYAERFNILYNAIHAKNPELQLVCSAWWRPASAHMENVFRAINGKAAWWDLHTDADDPAAGTTVDRNLQRMQELFLQWDPNTTLKCAVFEENGGLHDLQRALGHATTLNAIRRHGDFVLTSCPANALQPYRQNDNDWDQGQIFFTPSQVWGMPPFYAQQMAAANHQPLRVADHTEGDLDVTATCSEDSGVMVIHAVNTTDRAVKATIELNNFSGRSPDVTVYTLQGALKDKNSPGEPEKITSVKTIVRLPGDNISHTFPAHSYSILRFSK
jgi:alpha-L-arabinofuranosidase